MRIAFELIRRKPLLGASCALALAMLLSGCQTNSNGPFGGGILRPANPLARVPLPGANSNNVWTPPTLAPAPTDPYAASGVAPQGTFAQANPYAPAAGWNPATPTTQTENPIGRLAELLRRQNEQSRLSVEQQRALHQLTAYQRQQADQLAQVAETRKRREIAKIQQQAQLLQQQQMELEGLAELRRRSIEMDANNRDLHAQLAQSQQQNRLNEDQLNLVRQQLNDTAGRLSSSMQTQAEVARQMQTLKEQADQQIIMAQQQANNRVAALETTLQRRGGATIRANSSVRQNLAAVQIAGLNVRQDGDVIRIELPSDQIFAPGTATLMPTATNMVNRVAAAVRQHYPRQKIVIESHTDSRQPSNGPWKSNHQLSAAQATAVFEQLTRQQQFAPQQLFILGNGANHPVASNGTSAGQQRNRRVEVVIYPETVDQR